MPFIRDWSYNYHATTTASAISCPMPDYVSSDLLVAIVSTDTGSQTWSGAGWTQYFSLTNSSNLGVLYKYASAGEVDPQNFSYNVGETANVAILSVSDAHSSVPFAGYANSNISTNRSAMPTMSNSGTNSLLLYLTNNTSTAVIPSILEGPITQLFAKDGTAHSDSCAWTMQAASGTTPATVYRSVTGTTYTGVAVVVAINAPAAGAATIPSYCAADSSLYIDPINGTTAFKGNAAWANTITASWTSPLTAGGTGRTLGLATVAALADYGINTFRSVGKMTGPTTALTFNGARLALATANIVDVTNKNVLAHAMPCCAVELQTTYPVSKGWGIGMGMWSSANNAKVWHVHGDQTPWGISRVPCIVNSSNTTGLMDSRGSFNAASCSGFGFFVPGFLTASDWTWTQIWALDTTVVAGGNLASPTGIPGIVRAASSGHERISVLQQGAKQMLVLQPLQFGNGGTNGIYLLLDSTAIEFPEIYNPDTKQTYYCSVPNVAGLTYYAGPSDTIIHRNSIISSPSKYHWKVHASSSTSATYDFSGLSIIGAGDITLKSGVTFSQMTFNGCNEISAAGATLSNCTFKSTTASGAQAALCVQSPAEMSGVINSNFTSNAYGLRLSNTTGDTYALSGISYTTNTKDLLIEATTGTVTLNILGNGGTPTYNTSGAAVTINNPKTLTLTNLISGSEVRIFDQTGPPPAELAGIESSDTSFQYNYNYAAGTYVDIVVHKENYLYYRISQYLLGENDSSLPIAQQVDRQYLNP